MSDISTNKVNVGIVFVSVLLLVFMIARSVSASVPGTNTVLTKDTSGGASNQDSTGPGTSVDGNLTVFSSRASDLVSGDSNGLEDVFMRNKSTGTITRINLSSSGSQATSQHSYYPEISSNGRYVVFTTGASNLVSGYSFSNSNEQVLIRDTSLNTTEIVSVNGSSPANSSAKALAVSDDGKYVLFHSTASNLVSGDTNSKFDIFLRNMETNTTTLLSKDSSGNIGNDDSCSGSMSCNGATIAFASRASNLVSGDTNGYVDVFIYDAVDGQLKNITLSANGASTFYADVSCDGSYVAFESNATNLDGSDTNGVRDVFLYNKIDDSITRISESSSSAEANDSSTYPTVSNNGYYVAYSSQATNLIASDTNAVIDTFIKSTRDNSNQVVSRDPGGSLGNNYSDSPDLSADGSSMVFVSRALQIDGSHLNINYTDIIHSLTGF